MRILATEKFNSLETPRILNQVGDVDEFNQYIPDDRLPLLTQLEKGYDAILCGFDHKLDAEALSRCPDLKVIASRTTATDHIDTAYCREKGIEVLSLRGEDEFLKGIVATSEIGT